MCRVSRVFFVLRQLRLITIQTWESCWAHSSDLPHILLMSSTFTPQRLTSFRRFTYANASPCWLGPIFILGTPSWTQDGENIGAQVTEAPWKKQTIRGERGARTAATRRYTRTHHANAHRQKRSSHKLRKFNGSPPGILMLIFLCCIAFSSVTPFRILTWILI